MTDEIVDARTAALELGRTEAAPSVRKGVLWTALRQRRTWWGVCLTIVVILVAVVGPLVAPYSPSEIVGLPYAAPSSDALLGTDVLGRDVFSRVLNGGRSILTISIGATTLGSFLGLCMGVVAGYYRGAVEEVIMRLVDTILALPGIVLVMVFISMAGPSPVLIMLLIGIAHSPAVARLTRGVTLEVAQRDFVQAAEALGVGRGRIIVSEITPHLTTPLLVDFGVRLTWSIMIIAALSFLGFGLQPPAADWGLMINENRSGIALQFWAVLAPAAMIALLTIGTNLTAEGVARAAARSS